MGSPVVQKSRGAAALPHLGEYILRHQADIVRFWINMVDRPRPHRKLTYKQLADCVPQICLELSDRLKSARPSETPVLMPGLRSGATGHGHERWGQGYRVEAVIVEMQLLRESFFFRWLPRFIEEHSISPAALRLAHNIIQQFFDTVVVDSVVQFAAEQRRLQTEIQTKLQHSLDKLSAVIKAIKEHEACAQHDISALRKSIERDLLAVDLLGLPDVELRVRLARIQSSENAAAQSEIVAGIQPRSRSLSSKKHLLS